MESSRASQNKSLLNPVHTVLFGRLRAPVKSQSKKGCRARQTNWSRSWCLAPCCSSLSGRREDEDGDIIVATVAFGELDAFGYVLLGRAAGQNRRDGAVVDEAREPI